ncbi:MAG: VWA domain-containing protein [Planctomycetes bacterium]|nr:VWA domain-containing protein [Planctomycetota bacterium]
MRSTILALPLLTLSLIAVGCGSPSMGGRAWLLKSNGLDEDNPPSHTEGGPVKPSGYTKPVSPGVMAGWADDNQQYNYYLDYLRRFDGVPARKLDVSNRIVFTVLDAEGRPMPNCELTVRAYNGKILCRRKTYADGRAMFLPGEITDRGPLPPDVYYGPAPANREALSGQFTVEVFAASMDAPQASQFDLYGPRNIEIRLPVSRVVAQPAPLDIVFVIDTTGSMADDIDKLRETIGAINYKITEMKPRPSVRFGMVLYRDREDEYRCKTIPFAATIEEFAKNLSEVSAGGGGDTPEDMEEALRQMNDNLNWRPEAVKLAFLLTDAPPHIDYPNAPATYLDSVRKAAGKGIKITTIGASALKEDGEYILRQIAQYTMGMYVFLTYGEKGESGPETKALVSHHTGVNWEQRSLDSIIVRAVARELSNLSDKPVAAPEDYFDARPVEGQSNLHVLEQLFAQCARQIVDFSQAQIARGTPTAVLPPTLAEGCDKALADRMGDGLQIAVGRYDSFKLVERSQLKQIIDEKDLANGFDMQPATRPGKALAASLLILSKIRPAGEKFEMLVKLVKIDTGEVLSATMLKFSKDLLEEKEK